MRVRFSIKKPAGIRKSFAITRDSVDLDGTRSQKAIEDKELIAVNENLRLGLIKLPEATRLVKEVIIPRLKAIEGIKEKRELESFISESNSNLLDKFWKKDLTKPVRGNRKRRPNSTAAARYALLAAIRQIEPLSLIVATEDELQSKLDKIKDNNQHRRHAIRINQLLRFAGRNFQLLASGRQRKDIKHLNWNDLQTILPFIASEEVRSLAVTLFATGCRIGEAFTFHDERKLKPNGTLYIFRQMLRTGETRDELKNNKPHNTVLIPEGIEGFKAWCAVDIERKKELRASAAGSQIRRASRAAFPKLRSKWISPHDLRHSYAIYALEQGNTLSDIASLLGDDEATVRDYYTGYVLTDRATERIAETFRKKRA